ncbi:hypothetical protein IFM89_036454 [Coptis chinensis]|uniref:Uncharacterized protein n=1 Tax=Coptis chinensis TaxID=261450 RepID=A0A835HZ50_9MAGN|nr:hypothetical protein IFM89_036454 [Coptis chinensis]
MVQAQHVLSKVQNKDKQVVKGETISLFEDGRLEVVVETTEVALVGKLLKQHSHKQSSGSGKKSHGRPKKGWGGILETKVLESNVSSISNIVCPSWPIVENYGSDPSVFGPWCMMGDFNNVLFSYERIGQLPVHPQEIVEFERCLNWCGLFDLKAVG